MGLFSASKKRKQQKRLEEWLQMMKPYVFSPCNDAIWWHWQILPTMEKIGVLTRYDGLPVQMTKEECAAVNGGTLPQYWGEMPYVWRSEAQKLTFYAEHSELINRKHQSWDNCSPRLLLHGLNSEDSILAIWKLLFSPALQKHFSSGESLEWTNKLIAKFTEGNQAAFSAQYNSLLPQVKAVMSRCPTFSLSNPPWSMVSLDMRVALIPWITPVFERGLAILLKNRCALEKCFGEVLPFAFFLRGGPGDSQETAFRVCAPTSAVRASAEHWLMRAYLNRKEQGSHASVGPDEAGRTFSVHNYTDQGGIKKQVFFETTGSFGREEEDFGDFLKG